jgi:hypothetical protein
VPPASNGQPERLDLPDGDGLPDRVEAALDRLDRLIADFENDPDPSIQLMAAELLQAVDTVHRTGLQRFAGLLSRADPELVRSALADPTVRLLFELYDLLPSESSGFIPLDEIANLAGDRP